MTGWRILSGIIKRYTHTHTLLKLLFSTIRINAGSTGTSSFHWWNYCICPIVTPTLRTTTAATVISPSDNHARMVLRILGDGRCYSNTFQSSALASYNGIVDYIHKLTEKSVRTSFGIASKLHLSASNTAISSQQLTPTPS